MNSEIYDENIRKFNKEKQQLISLSRIERIEIDSMNRIRIMSTRVEGNYFTEMQINRELEASKKRLVSFNKFKNEIEKIDYDDSLSLEDNIKIIGKYFKSYGRFK